MRDWIDKAAEECWATVNREWEDGGMSTDKMVPLFTSIIRHLTPDWQELEESADKAADFLEGVAAQHEVEGHPYTSEVFADQAKKLRAALAKVEPTEEIK